MTRVAKSKAVAKTRAAKAKPKAGEAKTPALHSVYFGVVSMRFVNMFWSYVMTFGRVFLDTLPTSVDDIGELHNPAKHFVYHLCCFIKVVSSQTMTRTL